VLKLEQLQHTGSFKARGAFANLLLRDVPDVGVAAASGGNHGAAVAFAARQLGVRARVFVPGYSSPAKVDRIRRYGADLVVGGDDIGDSFAACTAWSAESGALEVHPYDQRETMLGTGTLAAELEDQIGPVDRVLAAVGGGGLLGGIASWFAGRVDVVGVEPVGAPTLHHALAAGGPVEAPIGSLAADSLAPRRLGELVYPILARWANGPALVDDGAIAEAQYRLWDRFRIVVEPGGATAFASLVAGAVTPQPGERIAVVLSGANTATIPPAGTPEVAATVNRI
jgi:threonine dehydratase